MPCDRGVHVFWTFSVALLSGWVLTSGRVQWSALEEERNCTWKCMLLTLQWPGGFCLSLDEKPQCVIPHDIKNWTIHGLWPMKTGHCCGCWPIFPSHLEELEPELSQLWPSLLHCKSYFEFWKIEWYKHGTCAGCVESMSSPTRYFQVALKLRLFFDIDGVLAAAGIKPSCNNSYQNQPSHTELSAKELHNVLRPMLSDAFVLQCVRDERGREVLVQLKISLTKNHTLGCPHQDHAHRTDLAHSSGGHPCPMNASVFLFPINYKTPQKPCD